VTIFLARPKRVGEGIPLAVKDLFDTASLRTTYGSIIFADHVPERTAEAVARLEAQDEYQERAAEAVEGIDLLVTPTLACVAPPALRDDREIRDAVIRLTCPFNALAWPALALPCGPAELGLPASVQLVAPAGEDARVLAAGALLEQALAARLRGNPAG
jgi:Asp-tRNA(Asn)/Glu-tRNA(Gln) amidotransferase A subunit family amidase